MRKSRPCTSHEVEDEWINERPDTVPKSLLLLLLISPK
jgi:hypothetical protein